ncbi:MAG: hypothetical protein ACC645_13525, partial [Pirellulales bacterium]
AAEVREASRVFQPNASGQPAPAAVADSLSDNDVAVPVSRKDLPGIVAGARLGLKRAETR